MANSEQRRQERRERLRLWKQWITSFGEGADRKAKQYFLAALVPSFLFAGLPMVGTPVDLPFGATLLALVFFCASRCLWLWEGFSKSHVALRWATIILAGLGYFWWVGKLVIVEYRKEQGGSGRGTVESLIRALPDAVAMRVVALLEAHHAAVAPVAPVVQPSSDNDKPPHRSPKPSPTRKLRLSFKDSPALTPSAKASIIEELSGFYEYLTSLGFIVPSEVPPIGATAGKGGNTGGIFSNPINPKLVGLWAGSDDLISGTREAYSKYVFGQILGIFQHYPQEYEQRFRTTNIFAEYFSASFANKLPDEVVWSKDWVEALWETRGKYGKTFVDRSMEVASGFMDDPNFARDVSPDLFLYLRFRYGEQAVTDDRQKLLDVDKILARHHAYERTK
jgi:hypothetical protein